MQISRIVALPKSGHAYNELFYRAVESEGVQVVEGDFSGSWIWSNVKAGDALHLHWPSHSYETKGGQGAQLWSVLRWAALVLLGRYKGARIIWTAHNLLPHVPSNPPSVDVLARHLLIAVADLILVHGNSAAQTLVDRFPRVRGKLVLIPHGNWIGYYPATHCRETAQAALRVSSETFVFLFIGACARYKNLDGLVRSFLELGGDALLIVAGRFEDVSYYEEVLGLAKSSPRIRLYPGFVPDSEVQKYLIACDAVVVPYREILTSGSAMLAFSFGRPVVSVSLGFLKDVVTPEVGMLFGPDEPDGLRRALMEIQVRHFDEEAILDHARHYTYEEAAKLFIKALSDL